MGVKQLLKESRKQSWRAQHPRISLAIAAFLLTVTAGIFGALASDVLHNDWVTQADDVIAAWFHAHMNLTAKHLAAGVSELAAFRALAALTSVLALLFAFLRRWHRLLLLLMAVPGGRVACFLLKAVFQRQRPYFEGLVLPAHGYSFPSDHAMGATLAYGFVAVLALEIYRSWPARLVLGTIAAFLIVLVGLSRVALNAHYPSDVLGAIAAGLAWLIVSFTIFHVNSSLR